MIDYSTQIVSALSEILPTYYELFSDGKNAKPCITYNEHSNYDKKCGDTIGYSSLGYSIKIWADKKQQLTSYASSIDSEMRDLGFHRVSSGEISTDNQICKIMVYEAQGFEEY